MIRRLLIANRGEIAVRIARTCRRLGIETVAVYSEAERRALHVRAADAGRCIGPAEPARSYLDGPALVAAARATGAEAIHPGYGFLSENAGFAEACAAAGLTFVGPRPRAIREMGSKERSRALAHRLGVPTVPGYHGAAQDDATLAREAGRIGYPAARQGERRRRRQGDPSRRAPRRSRGGAGDGETRGHGRFRRRVADPRALPRASAPYRSSGARRPPWSTGRICSIASARSSAIIRSSSRRRPAPRLADRARAGLREAALRVAEAIDYDSAGTVEFLVDDASDRVLFPGDEHPTAGRASDDGDGDRRRSRRAADRLSPAASRSRAWSATQSRRASRSKRGCAPSVPMKGFCRRREPSASTTSLPSTASAWIRASLSGSEVTPYYDSMLAKIVAHGASREEARRRLVAALGGTLLSGVDSNLDFLRDVLETEAFRSAEISTRFLETRFAAQRRTEDGRGGERSRSDRRGAFLGRPNREHGGASRCPRRGTGSVPGGSRDGRVMRAGRRSCCAPRMARRRTVRVTAAEKRYQVEDGETRLGRRLVAGARRSASRDRRLASPTPCRPRRGHDMDLRRLPSSTLPGRFPGGPSRGSRSRGERRSPQPRRAVSRAGHERGGLSRRSSRVGQLAGGHGSDEDGPPVARGGRRCGARDPLSPRPHRHRRGAARGIRAEWRVNRSTHPRRRTM